MNSNLGRSPVFCLSVKGDIIPASPLPPPCPLAIAFKIDHVEDVELADGGFSVFWTFSRSELFSEHPIPVILKILKFGSKLQVDSSVGLSTKGESFANAAAVHTVLKVKSELEIFGSDFGFGLSQFRLPMAIW